MMNKDKIKTVGILGGMGPYATAMFFKNVLDLTPAKKDWDHIRIIIDNNPHIPSRTRAVLYDEESPVKGMLESCKRLASYPVDFIVLPCNSACYFLPEVQKYIKTPILNIIELTSKEIPVRYPHLTKVAVLGGMIPYIKETYKKSLEKLGIQFIQHSKESQDLIVDIIEKVKLGKDQAFLEELFKTVIRQVKDIGAEAAILACTELTLFKDLNTELPLIDSSYILAEYTVQIALGNKSIPLDTEEIYRFWKERARMLVEGKISDYQSTLLTNSREAAEERDLFEKRKLIEIVSKYNGLFKGLAIEFGCGIGRITELLSKYFVRIDGIDYCEEFIRTAKENATIKGIENINYTVGKIESFIPENKYDCAICSGLIIFLNEEQLSKLVELISFSLNRGGVCIVRESMGVSKRFELHDFYSPVINSTYNAVYRSSEEIVREFDKYGFKLIHEEISLPPTHDKPETCQKIVVLQKQ